MREGIYEVKVMVGDSPAEEVEVDGELVAVVTAGQEYTVRVDIHPPFPTDFLRIGLFVDGVDVNYWKRVNFTTLSDEVHSSGMASVVFWGFSKSQTEMKAFMFAPPVLATSETNTTSLSSIDQLGQIRVVIYKAELTFGTFQNKSRDTSVESAVLITKDGEKCWKQPSVGTKAGKILADREIFKPLEKWASASKEPLKEIKMRYHTRDQVELLRNISALGKRKASEPLKEGANTKGLDGEFTFSGCGNQSIRISEDVTIVPVIKEVPLLDLTADEDSNTWGTGIIRNEY